MNASEKINELAKALVAAQKELRNPSFDSNNPHFKSRFVSLAGLRNETMPILLKHGLCVVQSLGGDGSTVSCTTRVIHESGQWIDFGPFVVPIAKNDAQTACAGSTYARRYSWQAAIGVVGDEDDDGNAASGKAPAGPQDEFPPRSGPIGKPAAKPAPAAPARPSNSTRVDLEALDLKGLAERCYRAHGLDPIKEEVARLGGDMGVKAEKGFGLGTDGVKSLREALIVRMTEGGN